MAIVELQFKKQAFLDFFKAEINRRRLPFPTLNFFAFPQLQGKLLEQIECTNCTAEATSGEGLVTIQTGLSIHYHDSLASVRAAGSLQRAVTRTQPVTLAVTLSIAFVPQPGAAPRAQLQAAAQFGFFPPSIFPMSLSNEVTFRSGAVEASESILAIRLGTDPGDPVSAPITDRTGNHDWSQLVPGQMMANQLARALDASLQSVLSDDIELTRDPAGAWVPFGPALGVLQPPCAIASAEITAIDKCIFDIDISVDLGLVTTFAASGNSLTTTLTMTWDADSTLCDVVGTLLLTPIGGIAIHEIAEDEASQMILGTAVAPDRFTKIGDTDSSITYQTKGVLTGPMPSCVVTNTEVNAEGMLVRGRLEIQRLPLGLTGEATTPVSGLDINCSRRSVSVVFRPAQVYLRNIGLEGGAPRLFSPGVLFDPADAWVAVSMTGNTWFDLVLKFADPPGGRLPVGTATSVIISTDCGVRWVDMGIIPHDHAPPTAGDFARMISQCMAISDPWGYGVMNLDWLVDPPDLLYGFDPLRQWVIGARELPRGTVLDFVAVGPRGEERVLGRMEGQVNAMAELTTTAKESLQIRTNGSIDAPAPIVFQRWMVPFASVPLEGMPEALAAAGNAIGIRHHDALTQVVEIGSDGIVRSGHESRHARGPGADRLARNFGRQIERNRKAWNAAAHLDRHTVAVVHRNELLICRATAPVKM